MPLGLTSDLDGRLYFGTRHGIDDWPNDERFESLHDCRRTLHNENFNASRAENRLVDMKSIVLRLTR